MILKQIDNQNWFAFRTKSRAEKKVEERLQKLAIEPFLPLIETVRIWSDRKKKLKVPLLPGFIFIQEKYYKNSKIESVPGIVAVVKYLGKPAIIKNFEIENLRILINEKEPSTIQTFEKPFVGDVVRVTGGPYFGTIGKVKQLNGSFRLVIEIEMLQVKFEINISKNNIEKITQQTII